jgi:hypothetical protein
LAGTGVQQAGAGCQADFVARLYFQPGTTYVAHDLSQPAVARASFTVLTSGTPGTVNASYGSASAGRGSTNDSIVGSGLEATLGTLEANGTLVLTRNGKPVMTLKQGRYAFMITDKSTKLGFGLLGPRNLDPAADEAWLCRAPHDVPRPRARTLDVPRGRPGSCARSS